MKCNVLKQTPFPTREGFLQINTQDIWDHEAHFVKIVSQGNPPEEFFVN